MQKNNNLPQNKPYWQTALGGNVYLLDVPKIQRLWFKTNYGTLINEVEETELMSYSMLENNIFGINERFIDWKSDLNGLVDDYLMSYICHEEKTGFVRDCLICVLEDCIDFEYFEMAHNLNLILYAFDFALSEHEKFEKKCY